MQQRLAEQKVPKPSSLKPVTAKRARRPKKQSSSQRCFPGPLNVLGVSLGVLSAPLDAVACGPEAFKDARVTHIRMFRTCMFVCIYIYI